MDKLLLSIFSFDTVDRRSIQIPYGAICALIVLACVEVLLHLFEQNLPDPVLWSGKEASAKIFQVETWSIKHNENLDVLILGPSHASMGISPKVIRFAAKIPDLTVYNGALVGRTYPVLEFLFKNVYAPAVNPRTLVLTVSPLIFNRHNKWMERNTASFFEAPKPKVLTSKGISRVWRIFLTNHVNLYRYRQRQVGLHKGKLGNGKSLDEYGYTSIDGVYDENARAKLRSPEHPYQTIMREFDFGGPSADAFVRILEYAQDLKIQIVVVNMPFRLDLLSISTGGVEDYREFLQKMMALQAEHGFTWLDYQQELSLCDEDFRDVDHLNAEGARKLSARLGEDIVSLYSSARRPLLPKTDSSIY